MGFWRFEKHLVDERAAHILNYSLLRIRNYKESCALIHISFSQIPERDSSKFDAVLPVIRGHRIGFALEDVGVMLILDAEKLVNLTEETLISIQLLVKATELCGSPPSFQ